VTDADERPKTDRWERSFAFAVPKERVWQCFVDPAERSAFLAEPDEGSNDHYTTAGGTAGFSVSIDEVVEMRRLRWTEHHSDPEASIEICVVFEEASSGSRITVTQSRFGAIAEADWHASRRGWNEAMADLAFYLLTGIRARRHFSKRGASGFMGRETLAGVEVGEVFADGFAVNAGLQPGDLLLDFGGVPVFTMAEVWSVLRSHRPGDRVDIRYVRGQDLLVGSAALSNPTDFPQ
jgi:uncharacterized protein YndB with AHSA1/START domain